MRQSQLFTRIQRVAPKDEISVNSQLLIRAGFVDKLMAGVFSFLPLGLIVLKKIENIIREEMNNISGQEILMPSLHPKENWIKTDRWKYPEMFKLKNRSEKEFSLGWTHEEIVTPLVKKFVQSYKDLPVYVYQIQTKFRDELRAKSGLLRGVEFVMKDLYSFHQDQDDLDKYYDKVKAAYLKIFKRCGLQKETILTLASGGAFSEYSHEFQTLTLFGEDKIYLCEKCQIAVNSEIIEKEKHQCPNCRKRNLTMKKSIEVGNIFKLNDRFSKPFDLTFVDKDGKKKPVFMGCYGIGLGRLMGVTIEIHHDSNGIFWPKEISPFQAHLIQIENSRKVKAAAEKIYQDLKNSGLEVLYDDRELRTAGEKFVEADLIGIPWRVVVSEKTLAKNCLELKERSKKATELIKIKDLKNKLNV